MKRLFSHYLNILILKALCIPRILLIYDLLNNILTSPFLFPHMA